MLLHGRISLLPALRSLLPTRSSLLFARFSPLAPPCSSLASPHSLLFALRSLLPARSSLLFAPFPPLAPLCSSLTSLLDWLLWLPDALTTRFWETLRAYEEERQMTYVTSVERLGIQKGLQQERRYLIQRLLMQQCGALPPELAARIEQLTMEQLEHLADALFDFTGLTTWRRGCRQCNNLVRHLYQLWMLTIRRV